MVLVLLAELKGFAPVKEKVLVIEVAVTLDTVMVPVVSRYRAPLSPYEALAVPLLLLRA